LSPDTHVDSCAGRFQINDRIGASGVLPCEILINTTCKQEARGEISLSNVDDRSNQLESATMAAYAKVAKDMDKLEADLARVGWAAGPSHVASRGSLSFP
jgi:hypothetical protein